MRASDGFTEDVKSLFDQLQGPFDELVRKGENLRYSFLNYNFVFRRIFDLLACSHYGADFPPLKSKKKRNDICYLWLKIITHLRLPYLNSDAELFGDEYETDIGSLAKYGSATGRRKRARTATATDADRDTSGLRRQHNDDAHTQVDTQLLQQAMPELPDACDGAEFLYGGWAGNGDSERLWLTGF